MRYVSEVGGRAGGRGFGKCCSWCSGLLRVRLEQSLSVRFVSCWLCVIVQCLAVVFVFVLLVLVEFAAGLLVSVFVVVLAVFPLEYHRQLFVSR